MPRPRLHPLLLPYAHHIAEMSTAVQVADAVVLNNAAAHEMFAVSMGM